MKSQEWRQHTDGNTQLHVALLAKIVQQQATQEQVGQITQQVVGIQENLAATASNLQAEMGEMRRQRAVDEQQNDPPAPLLRFHEGREPNMNDVVQMLQYSKCKFQKQDQRISALERHRDSDHEDIVDLQRRVARLEGGMAHSSRLAERALETSKQLERRVDRNEQRIALANLGLPDIELFVRQQQASSYDGAVLWKIDDYARRKNDAITGRQTSFYSPPFYTSRHGYKMCARIYLNGDGMGKDTHISVFFVVMRGQFDALLRWPFRQKVTIMLLDQDNVEHVIDAFRPDPNSSSFQRPRREINIASGCPLFCALTELDKHAYVRDDTMFMKISVDTSDL